MATAELMLGVTSPSQGKGPGNEFGVTCAGLHGLMDYWDWTQTGFYTAVKLIN